MPARSANIEVSVGVGPFSSTVTADPASVEL